MLPRTQRPSAKWKGPQIQDHLLDEFSSALTRCCRLQGAQLCEKVVRMEVSGDVLYKRGGLTIA
jgi:hypothetical protein